MDKIQEWRTRVNWIVACVIVAISYEIRIGALGEYIPLEGSKKILAITTVSVVILVLAVTVADSVARKVFSTARARKWAMKEDFLEGFWLLKTEDHKAGTTGSPISPLGVLCLSYEPSTEQYSVITTRLDPAGQEYRVHSRLVKLRSSNSVIRYLNHFRIEEKHGKLEGVSQGTFRRVPDSSRYELVTYVYTENEAMRKQTGKRLTTKDIEQAGLEMDKNGDWLIPYLKHITSDEE